MKYAFISFALFISTCIVNAQPRLVRVLGQQYANATWYDSAAELYSYNSNGLVSEITNEGTYNNYTLEPVTKDINTYNSSGVPESSDTYEWDHVAAAWKTTPSYHTTWEYNSSGKITRIKTAITSVNNFTIDSFIYNSSGLLIEETNWEDGNNGIQYSSRQTYSYNSSGLLSEKIYSYWTIPGNVWKTSSKTEYVYNSSGILTEEKYYTWDNASSSWAPYIKATHTYSSGKIVEDLYEDLNNSAWNSKTTYTYNTDGTLAEELHQLADGSSWVNYTRDLYFYDNTSGINTISDERITIYPNPSRGIFTVDFNFDATPAQVLVTDITGKQVFNRQINSGNSAEINLLNLNKGIYLLHLTTGQGMKTQKLVVE